MSEQTENAMDYHEHDRTYALFLKLTKYSIIAIVVVLVFMAIFLL